MAEVTMNTALGYGLYSLVKETLPETIVEIGGWDGQGSSNCIVTALKETENKKCNFYSLEVDKQRHDLAVNFFKKTINEGFKIHLLNGCIVTEKDF